MHVYMDFDGKRAIESSFEWNILMFCVYFSYDEEGRERKKRKNSDTCARPESS